MRKENALGRIMATRIEARESYGTGRLVPLGTVKAASKWLHKRSQLKANKQEKK